MKGDAIRHWMARHPVEARWRVPRSTNVSLKLRCKICRWGVPRLGGAPEPGLGGSHLRALLCEEVTRWPQPWPHDTGVGAFTAPVDANAAAPLQPTMLHDRSGGFRRACEPRTVATNQWAGLKACIAPAQGTTSRGSRGSHWRRSPR
jgi:hypothetical protein